MMEGCSVCTCEESEIPRAWIKEKKDDKANGLNDVSTEFGYGWISPLNSGYGNSYRDGMDDVLGRVEYNGMASRDWVVAKDGETYINLLLNPERYTGYSGPSASRVWRAIQQENCFGRHEDTCLEKRVFYRLMSGLQSSISTHIAKKYYYPPPVDKWGNNIDLFITAVGSHPDRLNNLYFAFLFTLRAVQKAKDLLLSFPIVSGDENADNLAKSLLFELLNSNYTTRSAAGSSPTLDLQQKGRPSSEVQECREGFDESNLFQVLHFILLYFSLSYKLQVSAVPNTYGNYLHESLREKSDLRDDFRLRFRNISAIMNCVSCERCRVWGKLQVTGLGTAIKVLLSTPEELVHDPLTRQEVIALVNTLHQVTSLHSSNRCLSQIMLAHHEC